MSIKPNKKLIVISGPTASGKTDLGIKLAKIWGLEVISADSRQFYSEMKIGTARPDTADLQGIKHHLLGFCSVGQPISAAQFEILGLDILDQIYKHSDTALLVGGSGLYIKALCQGLDMGIPGPDAHTRQLLEAQMNQFGIETLQTQLQNLDPIYTATADMQNPRRLIRALEVCLQTGMPYSSFRNQYTNPRPFEVFYLNIHLPRPLLYERINLRVAQMLEAGLVQEAEALIDLRHLSSLQTVGYKEVFEYHDGLITYPQMQEKIAQNTRKYAKRQITWFEQQQPNASRYQTNEAQQLDALYQKVAQIVGGRG